MPASERLLRSRLVSHPAEQLRTISAAVNLTLVVGSHETAALWFYSSRTAAQRTFRRRTCGRTSSRVHYENGFVSVASKYLSMRLHRATGRRRHRAVGRQPWGLL